MKRMIDVCVGSITLRELDQELYNGKANNDNSLSIWWSNQNIFFKSLFYFFLHISQGGMLDKVGWVFFWVEWILPASAWEKEVKFFESKCFKVKITLLWDFLTIKVFKMIDISNHSGQNKDLFKMKLKWNWWRKNDLFFCKGNKSIP